MEGAAGPTSGTEACALVALGDGEPDGWIEKRPDRSRVISNEGIATSTGRLPGEVIFGDGLSSTK